MKNMKTILEQDDCAPDSLEYFDKKFKEITGENRYDFIKSSKYVNNDSYFKDNYILSTSIDGPYWRLEEFTPTQNNVMQKKDLITLSDISNSIIIKTNTEDNKEILGDLVFITLVVIQTNLDSKMCRIRYKVQSLNDKQSHLNKTFRDYSDAVIYYNYIVSKYKLSFKG